MEETIDALNDRYLLHRRAGIGGMATVYRAQDLLLGRLVAVKILHESLTSDEAFLERFQQEAHAAANLSHPNIVTVHDIGQDGRRYYIVMEYVEGPTLKQLIRRLWASESGISVARAVDLAIQICDGVGYAHRADLIHCDVKSQNVLVTVDDRVKVTDFGIARAFSETMSPEDGPVWGTPQYFSPEQAAGNAVSPASDVYSIGVIFFEMLTGQLPFGDDSHTILTHKHIYEPAPHVAELNPLIPGHLDRIVAKVLSKEPSGRYRTAEQFGRVLKSYRENSLAATGPITAPRSTEKAGNIRVAETGLEKPLPDTPPSYRPRRAVEPLAGKAKPLEELHYTAQEGDAATDWTAIILGLVALISLMGLIPLWYLVYLRYTG